MPKVLLLGSGFVAKPCLDILASSGIELTLACRTLETAKKLSDGVQNVTAISLDIKDTAALDAEVAKHDLVISLIPYIHHAAVIKSAIKSKKNVVTTSYVSPAMMELDEAAKEAGITIMNEIGLDPGIDHLYAIKMIDEVHAAGGKIISFLSYCGGLPAPEDSDNPLGYKFSWSSRGVLLALRNSAKYLKNNKIEEIPGHKLMDSAKPYFIYPGYAFVAYPNRDSTPYRKIYNIPEAETIIRGTLRYQGFTEFVRVLVDLGFLSEEPLEYLQSSTSPLTWREAFARIVGATSNDENEITKTVIAKANFKDADEEKRILSGMRWLGVFSDEKITPRGTPLDTLCATLEKKMQYEEGERDMVILQHKFEIELADGRRETRTSTLLDYGVPGGYTSMARLVGVPCAVAAKFVLDGTINQKGVLSPMNLKTIDPLVKELKEKYGIECIEKVIG